MPESKDSKVILITGSSRGIGAAMARYFANCGHRIVLNYAHNQEEAEGVCREIQAIDRQALLIRTDVSNRDQVREMFRTALSCFGHVDVLINNAGLNRDSSILEMSDEDWRRVIDTNLTGTFICSQEFAIANRGREGRIINIASNSSLTGRKNGANYCSSKAGVVTLTKCLAQDLAPRITANCIILGYVDTEEVMERYHLDDPDTYRQMLETIPLARLGRTGDICRMANFLMEDDLYITGQNFFVNGGNYMG